MKIGDEALAVVKSYRSYKIVPVTITGVMDSAKSVSVNGESEKEIKFTPTPFGYIIWLSPDVDGGIVEKVGWLYSRV